MVTRINGLRRQDRLRADVVDELSRLMEGRGLSPRSIRVAFFDDDGPRGGVAIRCALTVTPSRGPLVRVEHTARTHAAGFRGALTTLARLLKRRVQRRRRRLRYPRTRPGAAPGRPA